MDFVSCSSALLYSPVIAKTIEYPFFPFRTNRRNPSRRTSSSSKLTLCSLHNNDDGTQELPTTDAKKILHTLHQKFPLILKERGILSTMYDECVKFRDPVTKITSLQGYIDYVDMLRFWFETTMQVHYVKQTGPHEFTARWTVVMKFILLPWKPELVLTGISILGFNPKTKKFSSHVDRWDSTGERDHFSSEDLWDMVQQLRIYDTPNLQSPEYQILKRTANYEVRRYSPFIVVENKGENLSPSTTSSDAPGMVSRAGEIPMAIPVFSQDFSNKHTKVAIQVIRAMEKDLHSLSYPNQEMNGIRKVGGIFAVSSTSGNLMEEDVRAKERVLRSAVVRDGLKPKEGCMLVRYNNPLRTWSFMMRNEVLIWLEDFMLE